LFQQKTTTFALTFETHLADTSWCHSRLRKTPEALLDANRRFTRTPGNERFDQQARRRKSAVSQGYSRRTRLASNLPVFLHSWMRCGAYILGVTALTHFLGAGGRRLTRRVRHRITLITQGHLAVKAMYQNAFKLTMVTQASRLLPQRRPDLNFGFQFSCYGKVNLAWEIPGKSHGKFLARFR
jgi:hypothetical protein